MTIACNAAALFNLYMAPGFFDGRTCGQIINELNSSPDAPAPTYGRDESGSIDASVRRVRRINPSLQTIERVTQALFDRREEIGAYFKITLSCCEEPQFLRYRVGDFFVAHQDGNTGLLRLEREHRRKISVIIFLNRQSETPAANTYGGGALVFSEWRPDRARGEFRFAGEAGMLVAFPSDITHEVVPVTWGERYSIVSWYG